jgi:hypothetical protein
MRHMRSGTSFVAVSIIAALFVGVMFVAPPEASAQATISTGSVQGAILTRRGGRRLCQGYDTNKDTGQSRSRKHRRRERITRSAAAGDICRAHRDAGIQHH